MESSLGGLTPLELILAIVVGLAVLAGLIAVASLRRLVEKVDARLDEQGRRADTLARQVDERSRATEDAVRTLDGGLRERTADATEKQLKQVGTLQTQLETRLGEQLQRQTENTATASAKIQTALGQQREAIDKRQAEALDQLHKSVHTGLDRIQHQVRESLTLSSQDLTKRFESLSRTTDTKLKEISGQVDKRLAEGFEKTTQTFLDVMKRLEAIDHAQKKITELSANVVSLQRVLSDRSARGAFGEVQLAALVENVLPANAYSMQHQLSSGKRPDCVLFLPAPTGHIAIDSKFPLENYQRKLDVELAEPDRREAQKLFVRDLRKHIQDVADKYISPPETSDGAILFLPAEAIFAEIHAHHRDVVDDAHARRVWIASPTTLMAILNTVKAVLRDAETRKQVHLIQEHLRGLGKDFGRFEERFQKLSTHIRQAHEDTQRINTSAQKISRKFEQIEQVELGGPAALSAGELAEFPAPDEPEPKDRSAASSGAD